MDALNHFTYLWFFQLYHSTLQSACSPVQSMCELAPNLPQYYNQIFFRNKFELSFYMKLQISLDITYEQLIFREQWLWYFNLLSKFQNGLSTLHNAILMHQQFCSWKYQMENADQISHLCSNGSARKRQLHHPNTREVTKGNECCSPSL